MTQPRALSAKLLRLVHVGSEEDSRMQAYTMHKPSQLVVISSGSNKCKPGRVRLFNSFRMGDVTLFGPLHSPRNSETCILPTVRAVCILGLNSYEQSSQESQETVAPSWR